MIDPIGRRAAGRRSARTARAGQGFCLLLLVGLLLPAKAAATPGFAEETHLGCAACHTVAPALTPFGAAFQRDGHRVPPLPVPRGNAAPPPPPRPSKRLEQAPVLPPDPLPDPDDIPRPDAKVQP
ncbi:MAG TPA: hypothetical protein VKY65_02130 [Alphaproteobacteria bacterium]|nr:hypothetical protein [Alphaproteobacteria bacterium]